MPAQPNLITDSPDGPGVHVLVIGVSAYRHLPGGDSPTPAGEASLLQQLSSPARSAASFANWMLNSHYHSVLHTDKLKSLRVLLSPSSEEEIDPEIANLIDASGHASEADSATVNATIAQFRRDCLNDYNSMAVVYVCGHGVKQVEDGAKMLLADYGTPDIAQPLDAALDLNSFYKGLYGSDFPQTQFWFYDCCSQPPAEADQFEAMDGGIGLPQAHGFADVAPIYMASSEGTLAIGMPNQESFFCQSLLWALNHFGAARSKAPEFSNIAQCDYVVTTNSLNQHLKFILSKVADMNGGSTQFFRPAGRPNPSVFHEYKDTMKLPTRIAVQPEGFTHQSRNVLGPRSVPVALSNDLWPIEMELETGLYIIMVEPADGVSPVVAAKSVEPSSQLTNLNHPATNEHVVEIEQ